jgi:hypothetical protein
LVLVKVRSREVSLVLRNARETPGGRAVLLLGVDGDDLILLDVVNILGGEKLLQGSLVNGGGESLEGLVLAADGGLATAAVLALGNVLEGGDEVVDGLSILENDDVRVSDGLASVALDQRSGIRGGGEDGHADGDEKTRVLHCWEWMEELLVEELVAREGWRGVVEDEDEGEEKRMASRASLFYTRFLPMIQVPTRGAHGGFIHTRLYSFHSFILVPGFTMSPKRVQQVGA